MYSTRHSDCNYINITMIVRQRPMWISPHTSCVTFPYEIVCEILRSNGFDHINRNAPVLVRSPKLTRFELAQYWGGRPPGNSVVLNPFSLITCSTQNMLYSTCFFNFSMPHAAHLKFTILFHVIQARRRILHIQLVFLIFLCYMQHMKKFKGVFILLIFWVHLFFFFWLITIWYWTQKLTKQNIKQKHVTKIYNN